MYKAIFVFCLLSSGVSAQNIQEPPSIIQMMSSFVQYNNSHQQVRGWRVQVLVTTDRRQMERARSKFKRVYPDYELLFSHENPFYHLKTGAFQSRDKARPFLRKLQKDFPSAFIVADEVEVSEILTYQ